MKFPSPRNSKPINALIEQVQKVGLPGDDLRELLWLINAHPHLLGFDQIAENLYALFLNQTFKNLTATGRSWSGKVNSWVSILKWIADNRPVLSSVPDLTVIYDHSMQNKGRHPVSRFGITRHGFYACLWNRHESGGGLLSETTGCEAYQRLQGHFCVAHIEAISNFSTLAEFETYEQEDEFCAQPIQIYPASIAVRELSLIKNLPLLITLPFEDDFLGYQQGMSTLESARTTIPDIDPETALKFVKTLSSYLSHVAKILVGGKALPSTKAHSTHTGGVGGGRIQHGYVNISDHAFRITLDSDNELSEGFKPTDVVYLRSAEEELEQERGGDSPKDSKIPILALYSTDEFGAAIGLAKYSERIKTIAAQRFPWNDNQLTSHEIGKLHEKLEAVWIRYFQLVAPRGKDSEFCQAALLIGVMMNFGVSRESARNLRWRKADTSPVSEFALLEDDQTLLWRIPAVSPDYRTDMEDGCIKSNRQMVKSFVVPDLTGLGQKIMAFGNKTGRHHERVFSFEPKTASVNVQEVIETLGDSGRWTPARISRVLENQVYAQTGDLTLAWCVCGNVGERNEPRMFYTAYPVQKLVDTYYDAIHGLHPDDVFIPCFPSTAAGVHDRAGFVVPEAQDYVGARFVSRKDVVKKLVSNLQLKLKAKVSLLQWDQVSQYHNTFTFYTWLVQAFSTSMRAVNDPSELLEQEETRQSPVYCLADKETSHNDRARPVFRSDLLKEQFAEYRRHREYLINAIGYQKQAISTDKWPMRLFYLDNRDEPQPLSRKWIEEQLEVLGHPMPGNFHRAYLRTELLASGCQSQVVDAFMGHANKGESPFDYYSSFEYHQFSQTLESFLNGVLKSMGLKTMPSRLFP